MNWGFLNGFVWICYIAVFKEGEASLWAIAFLLLFLGASKGKVMSGGLESDLGLRQDSAASDGCRRASRAVGMLES